MVDIDEIKGAGGCLQLDIKCSGLFTFYPKKLWAKLLIYSLSIIYARNYSSGFIKILSCCLLESGWFGSGTNVMKADTNPKSFMGLFSRCMANL